MILRVKLFSFVILCLSNASLAQRCADCKLATQCPAAVDLLLQGTPESRQRLRNAFCGFGGPNKKAQVCCSSLSDEPSGSVENHPNLSLLPSNCGRILKESFLMIFGGKEARLREFPWMVLISYRTRYGLKFKCGGTLINSRYVLTAAHCVTGPKVYEIEGVRIGEHDIGTDTDCQVMSLDCESNIQDIRVEQKIPHPDYINELMLKDIALLRLMRPVDFTQKNAGAICLPTAESLRNRDLSNTIATVAGWGYTEQNRTSDVLLKVHVPVYSKSNCSSFHNRGSPRSTTDRTLNKLCAGINGKDTCNGDSGGPLMVPAAQSSGSKLYQYGIVSYGPIKCGSDIPGVYTDVTKYLEWILDNIRP